MVGRKNNRRTQYTIAAIKEAFLTLLKDTDLSKITVTEICKLADVNRGTFYIHFSDPFDLYQKIELDLTEQIKPILAMKPQDQLHDWLQRLILLFKENEAASRIILANYQNSKMVNDIFSEVHEAAMKDFSILFNEQNPRLLEYYFTYFVKGTIGTILDWMENDQETSVEEITDVLSNLISTFTRKTD